LGHVDAEPFLQARLAALITVTMRLASLVVIQPRVSSEEVRAAPRLPAR
jgi:hypothetical protein